MPHRPAAVVLLSLILAASAAPADTHFVEGLPGVPLMQKLQGLPQHGVRFDKPSGRIVEAFAEGRVAASRVRRFYRETLPALGWKRLHRDAFARNDEVLTLDYFGGQGALTVRFTLHPR